MWYTIAAYFKFLTKASNQHGVHSPFVYNFITQCVYDKQRYSDYSKLKNYRNHLASNNNTLEVTDLGRGSRVMKNKARRISKMSRNAGTPLKRAKLLFRLVRYFNSQQILELGTALGTATYAMHKGNPEAKITTIEGCPNISEFTANTFKQFQIENTTLITGDFKKELPPLKNNTYDLVFFDGNHKKEATILYFETLLETVHNDSVFIFDDIYWSEDMTEAWEHIKQHPKVTVTVDLFFWGIVFFRKEQAKEHFKIRF
ncbi:class I SAM-dependent methyltransferase [Bizionia gelidisalsuginis]|uniref:Class I SAM-dependent methyltransferase n=3 Tax=Flavobacteriaceae TaxID=49546 RepID=A0A8H2QKS3_9FLAO|nr:class I SAM-dependent methyltransferase [Bizionia saleffrena]TYC17182.1 class I SAM-dependent methyltransferase [Bizionia gelidisalsuginis]